MKTVLIPVFQPFVSRNILNTGVLDALLAQHSRVVLLLPPAKAEYYRRTYQSSDVTVVSFDERALMGSRPERFFQHASDLLLDTESKRFHKMIDRYEGGSPLRYALRIACTKLFAHALFQRLFRLLERTGNRTNYFASCFETYRPDIIFAPNIFGQVDMALVREGKRSNIRTLGMVISWDNPTSKQLLRALPDEILVQSETTREELVSLHAVPARRIQIVGSPHYDYAKSYSAVPREDFCSQMHITPSARIILFSPAGKKFIDDDPAFCRILQDAARRGDFGANAHVLIRLHPANKIDLQEFVADEYVTVEDPGVRFEGVRDKDNELDRAGFNHLLDEISHADVVVNVLSSIAIDACVRGKPVVTIGFNATADVPFERSVELYLREENMAKLLATGGASLSHNPEELLAKIKDALENPAAGETRREKLIEQQCFRLDGHAKDRVADAVLGA